jgi:hypothetical protein
LRTPVGLGTVAIAVTLIVPAGASALPAAVTIDSATPVLTPAPAGGFTVTVGVTNLTTGSVRIAALPATGRCPLAVSGGSSEDVPPSVATSLVVTIPKACDAVSSFAFKLRISAGGALVQTLSLDAATGSAPVWSALLAFPVSVAGAFLVVFLLYLIWFVANRGKGRQRGLRVPLAGLEISWKFSDSWATNLTAASGLLVGVAGSSDFLNDVVGSAGQAAIGVATVAGLIAVALTGAAGIAVLALKPPSKNETTVGGLLVGTALALGAAAGQVWAVRVAVNSLDLGAGDWLLWVAAGAATLLVAVYGITSVLGLLVQGTEPQPDADPLAPPYTPELVAAAVIAASRGGLADRANVQRVLRGLSHDQPARKPKPLTGRAALP